VEISQEGLVQVQVNAKLGLTFPNVLRSFLRADPDIIMVGETRDAETAHTATAASLTGHLVFSTMHTNSAAESIVRLLDLDVDPFNFSDALLGVLGQRLVGRLCECKTAHVATEAEVRELAEEYCRTTCQDVDQVIQRWRQQHGQPDGSLLTWQPAGCQACGHTGYKGRLGVYELMAASPALRQAIRNRASAAELLRIAVGEGMMTLEQDAIEKILQGQTDLKQVLMACR
jgi:type II secretory ATPase GspE/PulE/Tfp pilus assembly ATPase PilB-like protein